MAVWLPAQNKFYLPPQPITKIISTDEYVTRTDIFYHATTDRLLTVGNPYYQILSDNNRTVNVPKVSPNQYRVFRVTFPDPNRFAFGDKQIFNPETERLVWALRGLEISRGQPLGSSVTGHPRFNRFDDVENPARYNSDHDKAGDNRQNVGFDPKQTQVFMVGCEPPKGEHWTVGKRCASPAAKTGDCPPLELMQTVIEDGDMMDIGFGNLDFRRLQENLSDVPLDLVDSISKYPDYIKMAQEPYGNSLFFFSRREQTYTRHIFSRAGKVGEAVPNLNTFVANGAQAQNTIATDNYFAVPSGSLVSTDAQIFNRPYWLQQAQGQNNGVAWRNQLFVTVADNTRGTIFSISVKNQEQVDSYTNEKFNEYVRHVQEFELAFIVQLCKIKLTPENLAFIHAMNPDIIEDWQLTVNQPPAAIIEDKYRFIDSLATKCPDSIPNKEQTDPYSELNFWKVDLSDRMSEQLDQYPLGRKFLYQSGFAKRSPTSTTRTASKRVYRTVDGTSKRRRKA